MHQSGRITTLEDVLRFLDRASLGATRKRDMVSAIKRICEMATTTPAGVPVEAPLLRGLLSQNSTCRARHHCQELLESEKSFVFGAPACRRSRSTGSRRG